MNHNQLIGVSQGASESEIQKAFRSAAMEIHPDHSDSPEAAEAFSKIKEARDKLLEQARLAGSTHDAATIRAATASAVKATASTAYATSPAVVPVEDTATPEELAHIQELDQLATQYAAQSRFSRRHEPDAVRRCRRTIATNNRRLEGKY